MEEMNARQTLYAVAVLIVSVAIVITLKLPVFLGLLTTYLYLVATSLSKGLRLYSIMWMSVDKMKSVGIVAGMMLMIGGLVALWMQIGTIPALIRFGFIHLSDYNLVFSAFVICGGMSLMVGSAIGSLSTVGVVFLAVGHGIGIPAPLMTGAIASGAYIGDRLSPLAGSGHLTAAACGIKLSDVFAPLMRSNVLPIAAAGALYFVAGRDYVKGAAGLRQLSDIQGAIEANFYLGYEVVLPLIVLLAGILMLRLGIIKALGLATAVSLGVGLISLDMPFGDLLQVYAAGYESGAEHLSGIIRGGGVYSMGSVVAAILLSAAINGILEGTQMIEPLLNKWVGPSYDQGQLVRKTAMTCAAITLLTCNQSLTALMTGSYFAKDYDRAGLERRILARTILDTGIIVVALIPWNVNAIFFSSLTGVSAVAYGPHAYYLYIMPATTILWSLTLKATQNASETKPV